MLMQLAPRIFRYYDKQWGPLHHRPLRLLRKQAAPNTKWRDGKAEGVDSIHLSDREWRQENNWCNPLWSLLEDLTAKLRQSSAGATVIAPKWPRFPWFAHLSEMASEVIEMPPSKNRFSPHRREGRGG
jgi:hypothetical protein